MIVYDTAGLYLESKTDMRDKITAIDAIISTLMTTAASSAGTANYSEYFLDDGQTKITTKYRDVNDIMLAITAFERLRQMYMNRVNGRSYRMVDSKNFINRFPC